MSYTLSTDNDGWQYVVLTADGTHLTLFVDGVQVDQTTDTNGWESWRDLTIADPYGGDCGLPAFSDIAVYDKALNGAQVARHYQAAGFVLPITAPEKLGGSNPSEFCAACAMGHLASQFGKPVDAETGNFYHSFTDISVPARGPAVGIQRTYNSQGSSGEFGDGWSWNYGAYLNMDSLPAPGGLATVTFVQENGSEVYFTSNGNGGWTAPSNVFATLTDNGDGTWTVKRAGTDTFTFTQPSGDPMWAQLTSITDRNGYTTTLSWPAVGQAGALTVTGESGTQTLSIQLNSDGMVTSATDSAGRTVSYGYDSGGYQLTSATSLGGGSWNYGYDSYGRMTSMSEPSNDGGARTTVNKYDSSGRVTDQWDPKATAAESGNPTLSNTATHFDYSTPDTTVITDPDGRVHTQVFQDGYTISDTVGTGTDAATTSFAYDPVTSGGASVTDPSGNTSYTVYTPQGWTSSTTDAAGNTTTYDGYDTFGNPGTVTANNVTTTYTYDSHGNLKSTSTPWDTHPGVSKGSTYTYNDPSLPADASNDPAHPGDVRVIQAPDGTETHIDYDPNTGLVTRVEDAAHGVTSGTWSVVGHKADVTGLGSTLIHYYRFRLSDCSLAPQFQIWVNCEA